MGLFEESNADQENRRQVSTPSMKPALDAMTQCRDMRTLRFDASRRNSSATNHLKTIVPAQLSKIAKSNPELVMYVNAQGNSCRDAEVVAFSIFSIKNQAIVSLNLANCAVADGLAAYLFNEFASNRSVTALNLQQNYIGDEGAIALAAALTANTTLKSLDIGDNCIGDSGWRALAPVLANNGTLTHANLTGSIKYPSAAAVGSIFAANTTLKELDLTGNRMENHIGATMIDCLATTIH
jgi:Ran GTPase-activating protein (RanGAP) involved in mRNA processing and transport